MKITLKDGREIERPFAAGAHGFVATKIEIDPDDVSQMREMAMSRPQDFYAHMMQLEFRFPERRAPSIIPTPDTSGRKPTFVSSPIPEETNPHIHPQALSIAQAAVPEGLPMRASIVFYAARAVEDALGLRAV